MIDDVIIIRHIITILYPSIYKVKRNSVTVDFLKMDLNKSKVKISKLVTVCSTDNGGFAPFFQPFVFNGGSRSEKSEVQVSFPSYRENLMFYEHFEEASVVYPSRLSFMYLGGNIQGEVNYDFTLYRNVIVVDVWEEFATVNSLFHIVSNLPKCRELRIYLSKKNIMPGKDEPMLLDRLKDIKTMPAYISEHVKTLRVFQSGEIDPDVWNAPETRFDHILTFAFYFLPKLECFCVMGIDGNGKTYDLIDKFCKSKVDLPKHNIAVRHGKTTCQPGYQQQQQQQQPSPSPSSSVNFKACNEPGNANLIEEKRVHCVKDLTQTGTLIKSADPRLPTLMKRKSQTDLKIKLEPAQKEYHQITEIEELPIPPKEPVPVVNLSDEDEYNAYSPKKVKLEFISPTLEPPSPSTSLSSIGKTSVSSCSTLSPAPVGRTDSLTSIGSMYNNDWESSSDEDEQPKQVVGLTVDSRLLLDATKLISSEQLQSILHNAKAEGAVNPRTQTKAGSTVNSRIQANTKFRTEKLGAITYFRRKKERRD